MILIDSLRNENRASVEHHECVLDLSLSSPSMPFIFECMWLIVDMIEGKLLKFLWIYRLR